MNIYDKKDTDYGGKIWVSLYGYLFQVTKQTYTMARILERRIIESDLLLDYMNTGQYNYL